MNVKDLDEVILQIQSEFQAAAIPEIAVGMKKYMKDLFPYLGIKKPLRAEIQSPFLNAAKSMDFNELNYLVRTLWKLPEREYQYLAVQMLQKNKVWKYENSIALMEWLLENKSWWDTVDAIAIRLVGPYMQTHPKKRDTYIRKWRNGNNMWLQRTSIIFQLKYGEKTDKELLYDLIRQFSEVKEFFIKKAIGWALRELSYLYPDEVIQFCNTEKLQALSIREAYKAMLRRGIANQSN